MQGSPAVSAASMDGKSRSTAACSRSSHVPRPGPRSRPLLPLRATRVHTKSMFRSEATLRPLPAAFLPMYGHVYVHPEVFAPHRYWDKVERGEFIPVVARDGQGEIVGHLALERGPGTQVAERGEAVVLPAHRGHGLLERMTERLSEEAVRHNLQGDLCRACHDPHVFSAQ